MRFYLSSLLFAAFAHSTGPAMADEKITQFQKENTYLNRLNWEQIHSLMMGKYPQPSFLGALMVETDGNGTVPVLLYQQTPKKGPSKTYIFSGDANNGFLRSYMTDGDPVPKINDLIQYILPPTVQDQIHQDCDDRNTKDFQETAPASTTTTPSGALETRISVLLSTQNNFTRSPEQILRNQEEQANTAPFISHPQSYIPTGLSGIITHRLALIQNISDQRWMLVQSSGVQESISAKAPLKYVFHSACYLQGTLSFENFDDFNKYRQLHSAKIFPEPTTPAWLSKGKPLAPS